MNARRMNARPTGAAALATGLMAVCMAGAATPSFAEGAPQRPSEQPHVAPAAPSTEGMTVDIDPQTGVPTGRPAPAGAPQTLSPDERAARSTSHEGLVEVPNAIPGGGVKLDLQGRFQSPLAASIGADGKVETHHLEAAPQSTQTK